MDVVALTVGTSWCFTALLCALLAVPLVRGRVKPNHVYGVRFAAAFRSESAWYAINRFGGQQLFGWAVPMLAAGISAFFLPLQSHPALATAIGTGPIAFVLIATVQTWRFGKRFSQANPQSILEQFK